MKKILLSLSIVALAAVMLVSCSKNNPKSVAQAWLTSFYQMDYEGAKKLSTEDTKAFMAQLQVLGGMMPDSTKKELKKIVVNIKDVKEEGDKATVTYTTSTEANKDQKLKLVKKDGKWLVQFSKNDSVGEGEGDKSTSASDTTAAPPAAEPAPAADTTKH